MKLRPLVVIPLLLAGAVGANAQTIKPGLWEVTNKMQSGPGGTRDPIAAMQDQMAKMPPEQRRMIQDMMDKKGATMGGGGPGSMSIKACLTKDMIERNEIGAAKGDCTSSTSSRVGNVIKTSFTCTNPPSSGEGQFTVVSPEAYTSKLSVTTVINGKGNKMDIDASGRWLGVDCGSVKPVVIPKAEAKK
jgi:Protein of unknown function (DUF3617)